MRFLKRFAGLILSTMIVLLYLIPVAIILIAEKTD